MHFDSLRHCYYPAYLGFNGTLERFSLSLDRVAYSCPFFCLVDRLKRFKKNDCVRAFLPGFDGLVLTAAGGLSKSEK